MSQYNIPWISLSVFRSKLHHVLAANLTRTEDERSGNTTLYLIKSEQNQSETKLNSHHIIQVKAELGRRQNQK